MIQGRRRTHPSKIQSFSLIIKPVFPFHKECNKSESWKSSKDSHCFSSIYIHRSSVGIIYKTKHSGREKRTFSFAQPNAKLYISRNFSGQLQAENIISATKAQSLLVWLRKCKPNQHLWLLFYIYQFPEHLPQERHLEQDSTISNWINTKHQDPLNIRSSFSSERMNAILSRNLSKESILPSECIASIIIFTIVQNCQSISFDI